jgi:hypothetical protein
MSEVATVIRGEGLWLQYMTSTEAANKEETWVRGKQLAISTRRRRKKNFYWMSNKPIAWWGYRKWHHSGWNSEGNRFITNEDL